MTLPISTLQSLVSRNRDIITVLHGLVVFWKEAPQYHEGSEAHLDRCRKQAVKHSKDIAKLVLIQKELKKEIASQISTMRHRKACKDFIKAQWAEWERGVPV